MIFWALAIFFLIGAFVFMPSFASAIMFALAILLLPIKKLQKIFPNKRIKAIIAVVLAVIAFAIAPTKQQDNPETKQTEQQENTTQDEQESDDAPPIIEAPTQPSSFEIHFIDVGQADAALVLCDGEAMLIDGGNVADSNLIYSYLKKNDTSHLDYIIATHAHEDHIGGLAGALNYATVGTIYCPTESYDSEAFRDFLKYANKQNKKITIPDTDTAFSLGSAEVKIIACNSTPDTNNSSIVLKITYKDTSFLFTGDAEREAEQIILDAGYDLRSTLLKVGHHGSESSTTYPFLREIMPEYAVISVGNGNTYGHPTEAVLSRLEDADVTVYRTDLLGDIICISDGKTLSFSFNKKTDTPPPQNSPSEVAYVGNKNSKKFHYAWCNSADSIKESNRYYHTGTREEMISKGYTPCKNCNP